MNFPFLKFPIRDFDKIKSLQQLREQLLNLLLFISFILGTLLLGVALIPVLRSTMYEFPVIYMAVYAWLILVTFGRRLPYSFRAVSWLMFFFILGGVNLYLSGFNADAGLFFLTFVSMSALLLDLRRGMVAFGFSAAALLVFGYFTVSGLFQVQLEAPNPADYLLWLIGGAVFLLTSMALVLALTVLLRGLVANLANATAEAEKLEQANRALQASEERYRTLVEISPDLVTLIGLDGKAILTNKPGLALFGYESGELAGSDFLNFVAPEDRPLLAGAFQRTLITGFEKDIVCQCVRKDGTLFYAEFSSSLIVDGDGKPQAVIGVGRDITERKKAERLLQNAKDELETKVLERTAELRSASERLKELVARSPAIIYAARMEENYPAVFYSENVRDLLGYSADEFIRDPKFWADRLHPQDAERVFVETARVYDLGVVALEYRFRHADGGYRWMRDTVRLARSPDGEPLELVGSWLDITAQKQAEESHQILLENSMQGIIVFQDNRIVYVNRAITNSFGFTLNELKSLTPEEITDLLHPDDRAKMWGRLQDRRAGKPTPERYELRMIHKNGETRYLEAATVPIAYRGKPALQTTAVDLTERKKMEQALRESEETGRVILNATTASLSLLDSAGTVLAANHITAQRLGLKLDQILGKGIYQFFPEEVARSRKAQVDNVFRTGQAAHFEDSRQGIWFENHIYPILDAAGQATRVVVSALDVTERKRMEQSLREGEEKYKTLVENVNVGIFQSTLDGKFLHVNTAVYAMAGYDSQEEFLKTPAQALYPDESVRERFIQDLRQAGAVRNLETPSLKKDGSLYWVSLNAILLRDKDGNPTAILGSVADITERKQAEEALAKSKELLEARVAERTHELTESREQLRKLAKEVVLAQEEERRRVARELHDEAGQVLVSLKYGLEAILADLPGGDLPMRGRLASAVQQLDQTMDQVRHLAHSLRPPLLDIADLDLTLKDTCREFAEATGLQIEYGGTPVPDLPEEAGLSFFRFLQEALTNVVKHAHATKVEVRLARRAGRLSLAVGDNGVGKPDGYAEGSGHLGMRERFRMLNGQVEIESRAGAGLVITAGIPWSGKPHENEI